MLSSNHKTAINVNNKGLQYVFLASAFCFFITFNFYLIYFIGLVT